MQTAINIENNRDKGTIEAVASAIVRIMEAKGDQKTIRAALKAFTAMAAVDVSINGATITGDRTEEHVHHHYGDVEKVASAEPSPTDEVVDAE